jgi:hypothetical protein
MCYSCCIILAVVLHSSSCVVPRQQLVVENIMMAMLFCLAIGALLFCQRPMPSNYGTPSLLACSAGESPTASVDG